MKITALSMIIPALVFSLIGCLQENGTTPTLAAGDPRSESDGSPSTNHDYAAILKSQGFNPKGMKEFPDGFMVEGDLFIPKKDLLSSEGGALAKSAQRTFPDGGSSDNSVNQVSLLIHPSIAVWTREIVQAVNFWNNIQSGAFIYIVSSGATTTIASDTWTGLPSSLQNLDASTCGSTYFYHGAPHPAPGPYVSINMDASNCDMQTDKTARLRAITHELGHVLRLTHTDDPTQPLIPGTPSSDYSVMNSNIY